MKKLFIALTVVSLLAFAKPVFAETQDCTTSTGSYGQTSTTCKVLSETTTVTHEVHETVEAGIGDFSFFQIALILTGVSAAMFGVAKAARRIYWFD